MNALHDLRTLRPASIEEAVRALAEEGAQPLAGGTDLLPNLRRGLGTPRVLVDLGAVAALDAISVQRDGSLRVGAAATLAALAGQAAVRTGW
ncbi:MAG: FAD binding domain-containing protein, partial [Proteobacteria bacterium]|nr:FAD binding domain-containing protein [Pseudomonadota bacterium]